MNVDLNSNEGKNSTQITTPIEPEFSPEEVEQFQGALVSYDHREKPEEFVFDWCGRKFIQKAS